MRRTGLRSTVAAGFGLLAALAAGCGGGGSVSGQVTENGTPYTLKEGEEISISIQSAEGKAYGTSVGKDGKFTITDEKGIPPGTYTVSVTRYQAAPAKPGGKPTGPPPTKKLPTTVSVPGDITVDLAKLG